MSKPELDPDVGLCSVCLHVRRVVSDRGGAFYRCNRAKSDPAYPKYPRLPVTRCPGWEREPFYTEAR